MPPDNSGALDARAVVRVWSAVFLIVSLLVSPLSALLLAPQETEAATPVVVHLTSGTSWVVPSNWTDDNTIEVIGGGGGGGGEASVAGSGGGGSAYSAVSNPDLTLGGSLCLDSNKQVVYNSTSDNCISSTRATKHDISPLVVDALSQVLALQPVSFVYNEGDGRTRYGFIAEDTASVDAHLATYNASGTVSGIDDRSVIAILVGAMKDLYAKVQEYFARTERLEERLSALEAQFAGSSAAGTADTHTEAATGSVPGSANDAEDGQGIIAPQDDSATTTSATTIPANDNDPVSSNVQEPLPPAAANDNQPVPDDENEPEAQEATPEPAIEEPAAIVEEPPPRNNRRRRSSASGSLAPTPLCWLWDTCAWVSLGGRELSEPSISWLGAHRT